MPIALSVVIPFRDEAESLSRLHAELSAALPADAFEAELIFVDDASRDAGPALISDLAQRDSRIRLISLSPHVGQSGALEAGFRAALFPLVAMLDADLQNDPADLPRLVSLLEQADCVCGVRVKRRDSAAIRLASRIANGLRQRALGDGVTDIGCSIRVMRAEYLDRVKLFRGGHRFLPALLAVEGARVIETPVAHRPRQHGHSKYSVWARLKVVWADLLGVMWLARRVDRYEAKELNRRA
ncbi:MAG: glycosyltransferase family 2 protein [Myxococcota bacterium]